MKKKFAWTVIIVAQYAERFSFEFNELLASVTKAAKNRNVRYVLLRFFADQNRDAEQMEFTVNWLGRVSVHTVLRKLPEGGIYNSAALTEFFADVEASADSQRVMLVLWGHGAGLGYFPDIEKSGDAGGLDFNTELFRQLKSTAILQANLGVPSLDLLTYTLQNKSGSFHSAWQQYIAGVLDGSELPRMISASQFSEILKKGFGRRKVDVLISVNCYMQMLETGFSLHGQVELLVAPQTAFPCAGFEYDGLFTLLGQHPNATLNEIGTNLVNGFNRKYSDPLYIQQLQKINPEYLDTFGKDFSRVSFSCNYLDHTGTIMLITNRLARFILEHFNEAVNQYLLFETIVYTARKSCADVAAGHAHDHAFIDLRQFMDSLVKGLNAVTDPVPLFRDSGFNTWQQDFENVRLSTIAAFRPSVNDIAAGRPVALPGFLSVFFPFITQSEIIGLIVRHVYNAESTFISAFQRYSDWDELVRFVYKQYQASGRNEPPVFKSRWIG